MPHTIDIYRKNEDVPYVTIKPDDGSTQNKAIMGDNFLSLEFEVSFQIKFRIDDNCTVFGEFYQLRELPSETKLTKYRYRYSLKMYSLAAELSKVKFLFLGDTNALREPEFSLMGNAQTFLNLLIQNAGRALSGWGLGQVISTDYKNLTFSNDDCLSALAKIAEAFQTEWWIEGKVIHLTKISTDTGIVLRQGQSKGLYDILRSPISGTSIVTRLYPYGGEKNLPSDYGSKKLRLTVLSDKSITGVTCTISPSGTPGVDQFNFSWTIPASPDVTSIMVKYRASGSTSAFINLGTVAASSPGWSISMITGTYDFIFISQPYNITTQMVTVGPSGLSTPAVTGFPNPYIECNTGLHGVIEQVQVFDDIFPRRLGSVTAVDATDFYKFFDANINFNVNSQLLPGLSAKVVFNTGQLAGYQFEINNFNNSTKEFKILKNKDETALEIPSATLKPAIGDKYVLVDIRMPDSYIAAAENELLSKANDLLVQASQPQYSYSVNIDPVYTRRFNLTYRIGDLIWIEDAELEVNGKIRIVNTARNIVKEELYQITLSDIVVQGKLTQINSSISTNQQGLSNLQSQVQNSAINNNKVIGDLQFQQGTAVMPDIPTTSTMTGFENVVREISTGKLYRKI